MDAQEALAELDAASRRFRRTEQAHDAEREATIKAVVDALAAGARPTDVTEHSPFTDTYVRRIARQHGIGPRRKGETPRA